MQFGVVDFKCVDLNYINGENLYPSVFGADGNLEHSRSQNLSSRPRTGKNELEVEKIDIATSLQMKTSRFQTKKSRLQTNVSQLQTNASRLQMKTSRLQTIASWLQVETGSM